MNNYVGVLLAFLSVLYIIFMVGAGGVGSESQHVFTPPIST